MKAVEFGAAPQIADPTSKRTIETLSQVSNSPSGLAGKYSQPGPLNREKCVKSAKEQLKATCSQKICGSIYRGVSKAASKGGRY